MMKKNTALIFSSSVLILFISVFISLKNPPFNVVASSHNLPIDLLGLSVDSTKQHNSISYSEAFTWREVIPQYHLQDVDMEQWLMITNVM